MNSTQFLLPSADCGHVSAIEKLLNQVIACCKTRSTVFLPSAKEDGNGYGAEIQVRSSLNVIQSIVATAFSKTVVLRDRIFFISMMMPGWFLSNGACLY